MAIPDPSMLRDAAHCGQPRPASHPAQGGWRHTAQQWEELPVPEEALLLCTECSFLKAPGTSS